VLISLGIFGAALFYGDGMITPAISVLSAVEGLEVVSPSLDSVVVPIALTILTALFRNPALRHVSRGKVLRTRHGVVVAVEVVDHPALLLSPADRVR
jgi:K+ transporter